MIELVTVLKSVKSFPEFWNTGLFNTYFLKYCNDVYNQKNLEACIIFVDFSKAFDFIDRISMSEILKAHGIPIEIIKAITMLYTNIKSLVRYPDGDTEFFNINA